MTTVPGLRPSHDPIEASLSAGRRPCSLESLVTSPDRSGAANSNRATLGQCPLGLADHVRASGHRRCYSSSPARIADGAGFRRAIPRCSCLEPVRHDRVSRLAEATALPEPVLHGFHHPLRRPDPRRPPATLLEARLHARNRVVPLSESRFRPTGFGPPRTIRSTLPGWLGIPGIRHSIGLARWWHFSITPSLDDQRHRLSTRCCSRPISG